MVTTRPLPRLSRRQMMKMSAGALIAMGVWPGRLWAQQTATKPLKFIVVNDFHYFDAKCNPFFEGMVKKFNGIDGTALMLQGGDLLDGGTMEQANAMRDILKVLKVPYHVTVGNHDYKTDTDRVAFDAVFKKDVNFSFDVEGWQFVGLDSADGTKSSGFDCHKETLDFAGEVVKKLDKNKPTFIFTHIPLGPGVSNRLKNADVLLDPFKTLNVQAIFNGHHHGYTEKKVAGASGAEMTVTTNRCCSFKRANHDNKFEKGFFVIEAAEGKYKRTFMEYGTDFPGSATPGNRPLPTPRPEVIEGGTGPTF